MKALAIAVAVIVVSALTAFVLNFAGVFAFHSTDGSALAARISASLSDKAGQVVHVTCPDRIPEKRGGIEDCEATVGSRTTLVRVVQDDSRGHLHWTVGDPSVLLDARPSPQPVTANTLVGGAQVIANCSRPETEPTEITFTCADAGILAQHLVWTSFGGADATGRGEVYANDCTPSCADGTFHRYPMEITLTDVRRGDGGQMLYSRANVTYDGAKPSGDVSEFELPLNPI